MRLFVNSRNQREKIFSKEAIIKGLAANGGLYVPSNISEKIDMEEILNLSYQEIAYRVLSYFLDDFTEEELKDCIHKAYDTHFTSSDITPISKIGKDYLLELYHGPTAAFKDIALTILPHLLRKAHAPQNKKVYILTATSGDTGKAALEGFKDSEETFITVFYPKEGVSLIQERQMNTTEGKNTEVIAVQGNFDDCQRLVKRCYEEISSDRLQLSSANSINIGRLVPQIVYYFKACAMLLKQGSITSKDKVNFIVPSGNFGNILAGYLAKLLGCPIHKLVCASNRNCVLTEFIKTGVYDRNRKFYQTISPSMDILVSSNLERLLFLLSHDDEKVSQYMNDLIQKGKYEVDEELLKKIQENFEAVFCDEENCKEMIREAYVKEGRLIDSHTAVAYYASKQYGDENINIIVSTASPYKFSNPILEALTGERKENEFDAMRALEKLTGENIPECLRKIEQLPVLHKRTVSLEEGKQVVLERMEKLLCLE
ncbi:threonine synthase [Fusobacterium necrophorum]|uniref:Threonine synthase n=1 Tax=Fusobacterium necrophorum TaxID=859 RepID=A0A4Q2L0K5_9FUSO|nr:threonine synthase [Fusobacterium necrophorum]RXZ69873.1 threonine synthase [Fusobacterium necrophorum]